ncbi:hypothetical protein Gmet_2757 [Geobacter metallireducens GS-15]|uniref:BrnA antitoxin of type II toxin-antitoxin system n=1 Tax=Geobacter metallireducens (strain ATCC 53774 / DSM 7210 / GS-15) TaxID=269799 RepID=Q39RZ9_GEOMG|nr:BrnA antitoxin family protein [Geobacter metallireducens]ABB32975.1 hypothetical protein Gmet_2757 [Geobacter metallireducens GS-15]
MKVSSDKMYDKYKDLDFTDAEPVSETPVLAKFQAETGGKSRITMRVDNDVLATFKARAEIIGGNYQTLMNDALRQFAQGLRLTDVVREAIHETWETCLTTRSTGRGKKTSRRLALSCRTAKQRHTVDYRPTLALWIVEIDILSAGMR